MLETRLFDQNEILYEKKATNKEIKILEWKEEEKKKKKKNGLQMMNNVVYLLKFHAKIAQLTRFAFILSHWFVFSTALTSPQYVWVNMITIKWKPF